MVAFRIRYAFTLVETLVVIVLISIVAAILYPIIGEAREKTRQATCISNQRQLAEAMLQIAQDHKDTLPGQFGGVDDGTLWHKAVGDEISAPTLFNCPSAPGNGSVDRPNYGMNAYVYGAELKRLTNPEIVLLTADANANVLKTRADVDMARHEKGYIASFADGHAMYLPADQSTVIFGDGDEGNYLSFGAISTQVAFKADGSTTGASVTVEEGAAVLLVNEKEEALVPPITVNGGQVMPTQGLIPGTSVIQIDPGKSRAFSLYCASDTFTAQKVDTAYQFGDPHHPVTVTVKKPAVTAVSVPSTMPGTWTQPGGNLRPTSGRTAPGPHAPGRTTAPRSDSEQQDNGE